MATSTKQTDSPTLDPLDMRDTLTVLKEYLHLLSSPNPLTSGFGAYKMTTMGKLFFASLLTTMATGQRSPFKVTGDPHKIEILAKAVRSSKRFQEELRRPGATVDSVIRSMDLKNMDAKSFERTFGVRFPF